MIKRKISIESLVIILTFLRGHITMNNAFTQEKHEFKYMNLLYNLMYSMNKDNIFNYVDFSEGIDYDIVGDYVNINVDLFENILFDFLPIYDKIKSIDLIKHMNNVSSIFDKEILEKEKEKLIQIKTKFSEIIFNCDFIDKTLQEYQLSTLKNKLNKHIQKQEYELCEPIQNRINEISK